MCFPHILDRIVELAPPAALLALRGVSRSLRSQADARLGTHIVADFSSESGPEQWALRSQLGGKLPVKLTYHDLSIPYLPSAVERGLRSPQTPTVRLVNIDADGNVVPLHDGLAQPQPEYTSRHFALTDAGGLKPPEVLSLRLHAYGDTRINVTFPPPFAETPRTLRAHCGSLAGDGRVVVPNWTGHQEWPHLPGFPGVDRVVLFSEIGRRTQWGVALPYTAAVDETGTRVATTRVAPPGGILKVVNTIRLLSDADGNARTFDNCALVRNVDPGARYEYVFIFDPAEPTLAALKETVHHELGLLSCVLVSLDWNVARNPVTFVGVDAIDPRLLGLPRQSCRHEVEEAVRANVERRSHKQVHIAQMLHADPEGLHGFAQRIRFLSHREYKVEVGEENYDLEARWDVPVQML